MNRRYGKKDDRKGLTFQLKTFKHIPSLFN